MIKEKEREKARRGNTNKPPNLWFPTDHAYRQETQRAEIITEVVFSLTIRSRLSPPLMQVGIRAPVAQRTRRPPYTGMDDRSMPRETSFGATICNYTSEALRITNLLVEVS